MIKRDTLINRYKSIRSCSLQLCENLAIEDFVIQPMPDASPTKWHLAHTSWFFEEFLLSKFIKDYKVYNDTYLYLFNSYYVQAGKRWQRPNRGLLSRPTVKEVFEYRASIDNKMLKFLADVEDSLLNEIYFIIEVGLNHEQQHQELMLTDLKYLLSLNPLEPIYFKKDSPLKNSINVSDWTNINGGIVEIGHDEDSFFYDNEKPVHKVYLEDYKIRNRLVTNAEYIEFINDGGYGNPILWLSEGFAAVEKFNWEAPLYWYKEDNQWFNFTLNGVKPVNLAEPVCHVSYFEADAFARWAGYRLPTEMEWENASKRISKEGNFLENENFHPVAINEDVSGLSQMFGDVWEWTASPYTPYPGYIIPKGAIGEYNGKFMAQQMVLRGGSCATSETHIRPTYRNFFYHHQRWQFMGIRLANY